MIARIGESPRAFRFWAHKMYPIRGAVPVTGIREEPHTVGRHFAGREDQLSVREEPIQALPAPNKSRIHPACRVARHQRRALRPLPTPILVMSQRRDDTPFMAYRLTARTLSANTIFEATSPSLRDGC